MKKKVPEIESSVSENTKNGNREALIETLYSIFFEYFSTAIDESVKLTFSFRFTNISSKTSSGEIKRVNEDKTETSSYSSRKQRSCKVFNSLGFRVDSLEEDSIESVFDGKVDGLSREISDDVSPVTSPKRCNSFLLNTSGETVYDS